ncbi:MAG TPA: YafY family protein [Kineosporiaceae bacterium]|nr:YafY family protein [Kineosporiaceae bacterium]
MANTSSRMLRLLSLLQTHRHWPGPELAARLEVSARTLRRDVERLRELGYPVNASRGADGGYQLAPGAALPPLLLDDDEAVAIAVGMQATSQGAGAGLAEPALRALAKVVQVMPPRLRRRMDALQEVTVRPDWGGAPGPQVSPDALVTLAMACRDSERVEFGYTARDGARTRRNVEPHRLVPLGRRWYVVAYDLARQDWRSFRVDRLTAPHGTGARFRPREIPGGDAAAFVRAGIADLPQPYPVEVVVHAPAEGVRERIGRWCAVEPVDPSTCVMRVNADALEWPAMALGMVGADFEVISPPELAELVRDWGGRFVRAERGAPAGTDARP